MSNQLKDVELLVMDVNEFLFTILTRRVGAMLNGLVHRILIHVEIEPSYTLWIPKPLSPFAPIPQAASVRVHVAPPNNLLHFVS